MITFENVSKRYLTKHALSDVNVTIPEGKIIGLVGSNGSGKSTFMKMIAGLVAPSEGKVMIDQESVSRRTANKVAYLSELDAYYSFFSVKETIDFFASQFQDFDVEKANDIVDFMEVDSSQKVKHLSKGNRGRLKIALTLAREVPVILMDEPLSGLDPMVRDSIVKGLLSFIDLEKQTVIITTHEVTEIEPLLETVIAIRNGKVLALEDVETIRERDRMRIVDWLKKIYQEEA
ncbi:ATP-binding cassette domain-containing protein [Bacillus hwajinpoensis]|uniref:ATP-binding cassette domain-containing protein n=1 Tax=Guptibacillus hwajinpoensis TaxID=208199 RepID=A0A845ES45_9BACL|nr:ABC transporter ATP-binding protein [Pseudalkalibacillus hwajinpoensis]MYL61840.1 ATP-binding cassette domain-containing protein [Pseudalkalibacillus hwajinpoensis]